MNKYEKLKPLLISEIERLSFEGINKMPTEEILCNTYSVSRQTLRKAVDALITEGLLIRHQGSGCFLTDKALRISKRNAALIIDTDSEYLDPTIIHIFKTVMYSYNYELHVYITNGSYSEEKKILNHLSDEKIKIIFVKTATSVIPNPNEYIYRKLIDSGFQIIYIDDASSNYIDEFNRGYESIEYANTRGHSSIATIFNQDDQKGIERFRGIAEAINTLNITLIDNNIAWYTQRELQQLRQKNDIGFLSTFVSKVADVASCIVCHNDEVAYWIQKIINSQEGIDLEIISFDNTFLSALSDNGFYSVELDLKNCIEEIVKSALKP